MSLRLFRVDYSVRMRGEQTSSVDLVQLDPRPGAPLRQQVEQAFRVNHSTTKAALLFPMAIDSVTEVDPSGAELARIE